MTNNLNPMKIPASLLRALLLPVCVAVPLRAATLISETFDKPPSSETWKADAAAAVKDGSLVLVASGGPEAYANTSLTMRGGDAGLDFTAKPVEIELRELDVGGTVPPADAVMVLILSADSPGEGKSGGYLKLRIGGDGSLLLMCGGGGAKETTLHRLATKLEFPVKSLKLRLSASDFAVQGADAAKDFAGAGKWTPEFNLAVWKGAAPQLMLRGVRRPGEGQAMVKVGALAVANAP